MPFYKNLYKVFEAATSCLILIMLSGTVLAHGPSFLRS